MTINHDGCRPQFYIVEIDVLDIVTKSFTEQTQATAKVQDPLCVVVDNNIGQTEQSLADDPADERVPVEITWNRHFGQCRGVNLWTLLN